MEKRPIEAIIVYCSPAGSTRHVAAVVEQALQDAGIASITADIGSGEGRKTAARLAENLSDSACLFVGSPVYVNHPVPPVSEFIAGLPDGAGAAAVPFVTWGGASSGLALYDMGQALLHKGFRLMGAAKVLARHCMMWRSDNPMGEGRPNDDDDRKVVALVEAVIRRLQGADADRLAVDDLDYQPAAFREELRTSSLEKAKGHLPRRTVEEDRCTTCGVCVEDCPTDAIDMQPFPTFNDRCIYCFNCVRVCPEDAITADLSASETMIRGRAERFDERPRTRIFL